MNNREQGTGNGERDGATITRSPDKHPDFIHPDQGFMLLGLLVTIFIILLTLTVAVPVLTRSLRRDRELEAVHRGNQYVRAIQLYYKKFGHYPGSVDQLEKTNNIRFLRQRYLDPITGKDDWHTIAVGTNKTTVKGFFGEPLAGLPTTGVGSVAGMISPGIGIGATATNAAAAAPGPGGTAGTFGATTGAFGATGTGATGTGATGTGTTGTGATGATGATDTSGGSGASASGGSGNPTGTSASSSSNPLSGGSPPFMGVGLSAPGDSIIELNEQTTYATWEFLYDPRIELLKAKAGLNSGGGSGGPGQPATTFGTFGAPGTAGATGVGTTAPTGTSGGTTTPGSSSTTTTPQP